MAGISLVPAISSSRRRLRVALLPAHQGRGIGTRLVRELQERAAREGRAVTLSVFEINPAPSKGAPSLRIPA